MAGDIVEGHGPPSSDLMAPWRRLAPSLGVWAVLGNHEYYGGIDPRLFDSAGIRLLRDAWAEVRPGLVLAGVDDLTIRYRRGRQQGDPVATALADRPAGATILLSHTPWGAESAARAGVGLMLCGHTHAGQIWPFGYLVRRYYPLFEGPYTVGRMRVIVCRGTGTWGPRMRLWRPGAILHVTLRAGDEGGMEMISLFFKALPPKSTILIEEATYDRVISDALRYDGTANLPIAVDAWGPVLMSSFTKTISPGTKCGYMVVPASLVGEVENVVSNTRLNPNLPTQAFVADFIDSGRYADYLAYLRDLYRPRMEALNTALATHFPGAAGAPVTG